MCLLVIDGLNYRYAVLARIIGERLPEHPETHEHLATLERIGCRGMRPAGRGMSEDWDALHRVVAHVRLCCEDGPLDPPGYALRVAALEAEGMTTSDSQGVADVEFMSMPTGGHEMSPAQFDPQHSL